MAIVYRYEIECEREDNVFGAYTATECFTGEKLESYLYLRREMVSQHSDDAHPCIREDLAMFEYGVHYCACLTIKSLKDWFKGFNISLKRLGFKLVEVEVAEIFETESGLQVAYKLEDIINKKVLK